MEAVQGAEEPAEHRVRANGIELAAFEWGRAFRGRGPTVLLAHATGFHARCWDPVVAHLRGLHVVALDQRGHGRSQRTEITHWNVFGRDLAAFVRALDLRDVLGAGHSMGGHAMVDAAAGLPDRFRRLVLVDPVIAAPGEYGGGGWTITSLGGRPHPTSRRKRRFPTPEAMIERFRDRVPYRVFRPEALRAYCVHGLLPAEDGDGFELACPPEIEAAIYMTSRTNAAVHESIRRLAIPVLIVRAKRPPEDRDVMDFSSSPTWPGLVDEFRDAREIHLEQHTHFLPMEIPERIAEWIHQEARNAASGGSHGAS
jgi:pimeloyl-ACP methyl ester carboxylesterase